MTRSTRSGGGCRWFHVDKEYTFEGPKGKVTLAQLFAGKRQLIVQHVMFGPDWDAPCPSCSKAIPR